QIARDLSGPAPEVAHASATPHARRKAVEHLAVERLAIELLEVLRGILLRDRVVARHDAGAGAPVRRRRGHHRALRAGAFIEDSCFLHDGGVSVAREPPTVTASTLLSIAHSSASGSGIFTVGHPIEDRRHLAAEAEIRGY